MLLKNFIKKISENIYFFILVFADFRKFFLEYFLKMSGLKVVSLAILATFFLQILFLIQKTFQDYKLLFSIDSLYSLFFVLIAFPLFYASEKFYTVSFISKKYSEENVLDKNIFSETLQILKSHRNPVKLWLVYIFSQTKFFLDFSLLFVFLFLIFFQNITNSFWYFSVIFVCILFLYFNLKFWRGSVFLFSFWKEETNLKSAFQKSLEFTSSKKIEILVRYIVFRFMQFLVLASVPFLLYTKKLHLIFFEYLTSYTSNIFAFYLTIFLVIFSSIFLYSSVLLLDSIFWTRIYHFLQNQKIGVLKSSFKVSSELFLGIFVLFFSFFIIIFLSYKTILINFDNLAKNSNSANYQKLIAISGDPSNISTKIYLQNSVAKGENAIAVQGFFEENNFKIKPLYSFPDNIFVSEIFSIAPIFSFESYQSLQRKLYPEGKISFMDAYNSITFAGRSVFLYIPKQKITEEEFAILEKELEKSSSYFLVIFSSDKEVLDRLKAKFPNFRFGLLSTIPISDSYEYQTFFTFSNFVSLNKNSNSAKNFPLIYSIHKKNESISAQVDLENIHGILSDQTLSAYNSLREKSEKEYYLKYLSAPLTFFGF